MQLTVVAVLAAWSASSDYTDGLEALRGGQTTVAAAKLATAYAADRANPDVKFAWATVAPCSTAVTLYRELVSSAATPDSLKARAAARLGDRSFALGDCAAAREHYRNAARLSKDPRHRHFWALACQCNGDDETAKSLWHTLAQEHDSAIAQAALCNLGKLHLRRSEYDLAYSTFLKAGTTDANAPWVAEALLGKYESARHLGLTDKASLYKKQLDAYGTSLLEAQRLRTVSAGIAPASKPANVPGSSVARPVAAAVSGDSALSGSGTPRYALQVGAFGSPENAEKLRSKLSRDFRDVSVTQTALAEQVFYRVRIGSFSSKEEAETFGAGKLAKSGLSYRVVER